MRNYIREHIKGFIGITFLMIFTVALIGSTELIAKMLPDAYDLTPVKCISEDGKEYAYTGEEITPVFNKLVFKDKEGNTVKVEEGDFSVLTYMDNVEFGYADMEVALEGYRHSVVIEDAFQIVLGAADGLEITESSMEGVTLVWEQVPGADGYIISKSVDGGTTFAEMQRVDSSADATWTDTALETNATYFYHVQAFRTAEEVEELGDVSENVKHITPLADPVLAEVKAVNSQSITVTWNLVPGAVGYEVYRSADKGVTFELVSEIMDAVVNSYTDVNREIGVEYHYYVIARQQIEETMISGNPSNILFASTVPDSVSLKGNTNGEQTSASLTWAKVTGVDGYEIYKGQTLVNTVPASTNSWSETGLTATSAYTYKVRAFKEVNGQKVFGSYSNEYTKPAKINYQYTGTGSGSLEGVTSFVGTSYVPGGFTPSGWDCSGFTQWALKNYYGASIPKAAASQGAGGVSINVNDRSQWQAGDILCYANSSGRISHVALYLGNGQLMHALNTKYNTFIQGVDYYETWDSGNSLAKVQRYH